MTMEERRSWSDADVLCPFFRALSRETITVTCEGWARRSESVTRFRDLKSWHRQIGTHCASRYEHCPVFEMIMECKYPEDLE